jgi:catechol 2,3-dioxygenase-like lactoylglutathione lyase family enzyme
MHRQPIPLRGAGPPDLRASRFDGGVAVITGVHALIYTPQAEAVRAFFRDVLGFPSVDAGPGWLIFGLPPAELGIHPADAQSRHELYLMCDDVSATVAELRARGVETGPVRDQGFGMVTSIRLPGGDTLDLYQPRHPTALGLRASPGV